MKKLFILSAIFYSLSCPAQSLYTRNKEIMDSIRAMFDALLARPTTSEIAAKAFSYRRNDSVFAATVNSPGDTSFAFRWLVPSWSTLTGKPSTFTAASHTHAQSEVTGLVAALAAKQDALGFTAVANTVTVNGHPLSANVSVTAGDVGLGNVNNTSDAGKPVSTATQTALDLKAPLISPSFTTPALGTPASGNLANCTFPTLNQNTTGTAGGLSADIAESRVTNLVADLAAKAPLVSPSFTTPSIGTATGSALAVTGNITSSGGSIGYATGAGGSVTQATSRSTGVTLNKISGAITTNNTSLAAGAEAQFTVTNSTVAIGDVILLSTRSGQTSNTSVAFVTAVAAGSFQITLSNLNATTADTGAMVINFIVLKAVSN